MQKYTYLFFLFISLHLSTNAQDKGDYREKFTEGNYLILEGNYPRALKSFKEAYAIDSSSANVNFKLGFCYLKTVTEKHKALAYLEKAVLNTTKNYTDLEPREQAAPINAFYYYGEALHLHYKFDEAIAYFEKFKSFLKPKQEDLIKDVNRHIEIANTAKIFVAGPVPSIITNLGDSINTSYPEYSPVLSADESTLIFTSRRPGSTGGDKTDEDEFYEDIFISYRKPDSTWTTPVSISTNVNSITHEASVGLTADAQTLLIYKDGNGGDIYFSNLDGDNWTFPQQMGSDINSPGWETSACLTPDGNTLYFVSDRKEGGLGGRDIWKCVKLPNGKWSRSMNLGAPINTPYDEESPFIHPSGDVLFFSSKGHQTIGGFDIFFSERLESTWDKPINIGYPINTTDDDVFYVTSPDGKRGYYSSSSRPEGYGEKDLYMISIPERKEQPLVLIKGVIIPAAGTQLPSNLEIVATNNETGIVTGIYKPLMRDGSFTIIIPPNSNYTLSYQQDGEEFYSELMEVPADAAYQEINKEVKLKGVNFGQPVNITAKDSLQPAVTNKEIAYISVGGRLLDKDNKPMNNMKVNLMNSEGQVVKTTTSDALGWFLFSELPQNQNYVVALEETDTEIGKKSFVEFRDAEGKVIKTKNLGSGKYQMASSNTTVKFKAKDKPAPSPVHHEQLASVNNLEFKMNFKYNITEIDINDEPFKQFINNLMDLYNKNGIINLKIVSSASTVPTRAFSSNKELSVARADKGKNQIINALKEKGVDVSKIKIVSIKSQVGGPQYSIDYIQNKEKYEQYQFIKASAY
jgi:outer membrane protein OmpA-like peptidoglycan-associated protein